MLILPTALRYTCFKLSRHILSLISQAYPGFYRGGVHKGGSRNLSKMGRSQSEVKQNVKLVMFLVEN